MGLPQAEESSNCLLFLAQKLHANSCTTFWEILLYVQTNRGKTNLFNRGNNNTNNQNNNDNKNNKLQGAVLTSLTKKGCGINQTGIITRQFMQRTLNALAHKLFTLQRLECQISPDKLVYQ